MSKGPFKRVLDSGIVEIPIGSSSEDSYNTKQFVYGQANSAGSKPFVALGVALTTRHRSEMSAQSSEESILATTALPATAVSAAPLQWLSQHHRMLFHYFISVTISIFDDSKATQRELRSAILPMAVDTTHGFPLLAATLSLASTHRLNLGLHQDVAEIEYWRDMSIAYLRRAPPDVGGSTANVHSATALMLCIRDAISGNSTSSWRLHLQGAITILEKQEGHLTHKDSDCRRLLGKLAKSLQLRSLHPSCLLDGRSKTEATLNDFEVLGLSPDLAAILCEVHVLHLDRAMLQEVETNSDSSAMARIWGAWNGRCTQTICRAEALFQEPLSNCDSIIAIHQLYAHAAVLMIYACMVWEPLVDTGLRKSQQAVSGLLPRVHQDASARASTMLTFPLFTIGCFLSSRADRQMVSSLLERGEEEHGKRKFDICVDVS
ncbi:hypothetical protein LTR37_012937 [Vermiconidia calcicola]|uniref:Uncharacterized protein n=1 Tax=Vermiconidia calcicola TaxID=1690605 RepID=A0ACC3MYJ5_9PEZI|nr:hypothetical protein LTR37_012937 [Vermiconidia calcicola]